MTIRYARYRQTSELFLPGVPDTGFPGSRALRRIGAELADIALFLVHRNRMALVVSIKRKNGRRGVSMAYAITVMGAMFGFASFAVDYGRVQVAKTEARTAATAAARYGAMMLPNGSTSAIASAVAAGAQNKVDGKYLTLNAAQDIQIGVWTASTKSFVQTYNSPNAVRVIARRTAARGNPIPTIFAQAIGFKSCDVNEEAIAMLKAPVQIRYDVPATASPYLAGMPNGTMSSLNNPHNSPDRAPTQSPIDATSLSFKPGETLSFDNISGGANNDSQWAARYNPDGNLDWMTGNDTTTNSGELCKSNLYAPINALVGVFLTDADPRTRSTPETLDFRTDSSRDFSELKPKVGQVFFIGDGKRANGEAQRFVVPAGATRFYLANWDGYEWNNNVGLRTTMATKLGGVVTVK